MANRAAQIRAENPGLEVVKRDRHGLQFDLGNGQRKAVLTIEPLHVRNSETEIDASWVPDSGAWQHKIAAADFEVHARSVLNSGDLVQWVDPTSGESVTLQPLALNWVDNATDSRQQITQPQAVTAQPNDATLNWPDGYGAGRHFRYTAHPTRLIKHLIIDSAAALPAPTVANPYLELEFILKESGGVTLHVDGQPWDGRTKTATANRIEFRVNATGQTAWLFEAPGATDSSAEGNGTAGIFQLRRQGNTRYCTVRIPKAWLDTAVYPVYLDPTLTLQPDGTDGLDTFIQSNTADTNNGTSNSLPWGTYSTPYIIRSLIKFDLSTLPDSAVISSATFSPYLLADFANQSGTWAVYRLKRAWVESEATWNIYSTGNSWSTAGAFHADDCEQTAIATRAFTATEGIGQAKDFALPTTSKAALDLGNGWLLKSVSEANTDQYNFGSSDHATAAYRPKLVVVYTMPPSSVVAQPARIAATGSVTAASAGTTGTATITAQPVSLAASGTVVPPARTATATVTTQPAQLAATGQQAISGTASVTVQSATIAASGGQTFSGTAAASVQPARLSASGAVVPPARTGTASLAAQSVQLSASATTAAAITTGTGAVTAQSAALSASGNVGPAPVAGTGSVTAQSADLSAAGALTGGLFTGTGSVLAQAAEIAAAAWERFEGTGSETAAPPAITGTGSLKASGTGSVTGQAPDTSGEGSEQFIASVNLAAAFALISAAGTVLIDISGTGSLEARAATLAAVGSWTVPVYMGLCSLSVAALGSSALSVAALGSSTLTVEAG